MGEEIYEDIQFLEFSFLNNAIDLVKDRSLETDFGDDKNYLLLKKSIYDVGILNNLILARNEDDSLEILAGRRRLHILKELATSDTKKIPVKILKKEYSKLKYEICYSDNKNRQNINNLTQYESLLVDLTISLVGYSEYRKRVEKSTFSAYITQYETINILKEIKKTLENKGVIQEINDTSKNKKIQIIQTRLDELSNSLSLDKKKIISIFLKNSLTPTEKILISNGFDSKMLIKQRKNKTFQQYYQDYEIACYNLFLKNQAEIEAVCSILKKYNFSNFLQILEENKSNFFDKNNEKTHIYKQFITKEFKNQLLKALVDNMIEKSLEIENTKKTTNTITELKKRVSKILNSDSQEAIEELNNFMCNLEKKLALKGQNV